MPMADKSTDPAALWQTMLGEMEKGFNAFASQAMASPEFSKVMNQAGSAGAGAQKQFGDMMEKYLLSINLPSRAQLVDIGGRLQSIETQLSEIRALLRQSGGAPDDIEASAPAPRPPRTKRPPSPEGTST
jgi:hypothetical protein